MLGFLYLLLNYWRVNSWVSCGTPTKVTGAFPDFCQDDVADASPILSRCPTVVFKGFTINVPLKQKPTPDN